MPGRVIAGAGRSGRIGRRLAAGLSLVVVAVGLPVIAAGPAQADDWLYRPASGAFDARGHGEGHGRGMSQYGAQGAALQGLSSTQILDFYYPGTVATQVDGRRALRVWISGDNDGVTEVIRSADLEVRDDSSGAVIAIPGNADRVRTVVSGSGLAVQARVGGSWQDAAGLAAARIAAEPQPVDGVAAESAPDAPTVDPSAAAPAVPDPAPAPTPTADPAPGDGSTAVDPTQPGDDRVAPSTEPAAAADPTGTAGEAAAQGLRSPLAAIRAAAVQAGGPVSFRATSSGIVEVVTPAGDRVGYRGTVRAVRNGGSAITTDELALDDYVRAVVPRESPSSWRPAALESQSVAARSYAYGYRSSNSNYDICDTAACQVYGGATKNGAALEVASTNAAAAATSGIVRTYNGAPINAQFGSTNGGWTVDGRVPYLPAQRDPYEALGNPPQAYANWTGTLTVASLESRFPSIGSFTRLRISERDGNGDWGGRVVAAVVEGSGGSITITGDQLRLALTANVRSTYFQLFDTAAVNAPKAALDYVGANGSTFGVAGWAFDPDAPTDSIPVHVYDTAPSGRVTGHVITAASARPDVAAVYPGVGAAHGFSVLLPLQERGTHQICLYAINVGAGSGNTGLGCRSINVGGPFGSVDQINGGAGYFAADGWAIDTAAPTGPAQVHVYVTGPGGTVGYPGFIANRARGDVAAAYPGSGTDHGFTAFVPTGPAGSYTLCGYAIATDGGSSSQIGCRAATVVDPIGRLDVVASGGGSIAVGGWTFNPGAPAGALEVRAYVFGPDGTMAGHGGITANVNRSDVGAAFPAAGADHGFSTVVPAVARGTNRVCVYAISNGPSTGNPQLGCAEVTVG